MLWLRATQPDGDLKAFWESRFGVAPESAANFQPHARTPLSSIEYFIRFDYHDQRLRNTSATLRHVFLCGPR